MFNFVERCRFYKKSSKDADIEPKVFESGWAKFDFRISYNQKRKLPNGDWAPNVFKDAEYWVKPDSGDINYELICAGREAVVWGRLCMDEWVDTDGKKRQREFILIEQMASTGLRTGNRSGAENKKHHYKTQTEFEEAHQAELSQWDDSEIPF